MRIFERENLQLLIGAIIALACFVLFNQNSYAASAMSCETNFGEKSFVIQDQSVAFVKQNESGRSISSVMDSQTKKSHLGFKKTLYVDGNKYFINISNENKLNNADDFLAVTNPKGHKMTYPLNCHLI